MVLEPENEFDGAQLTVPSPGGLTMNHNAGVWKTVTFPFFTC